MAKYIKGKDGKLAGSIGDGKNKVPTPNPKPVTPKQPPAQTLTDGPLGHPAILNPTGNQTGKFMYGQWACTTFYDKKTGYLSIVLDGYHVYPKRGRGKIRNVNIEPVTLYSTDIGKNRKLSYVGFAGYEWLTGDIDNVNDKIEALLPTFTVIPQPKRRRFLGIF